VSRVVITGCGLVTPAGVGLEESWRGLLAGRSFCREAVAAELGWPGQERLWGEPFAAGVVPAHNRSQLTDPTIPFAQVAAREAWHGAGLSEPGAVDPAFGCVVGTSKGGLLTALAAIDPARHEPASPFMFDPAVAARRLAADWGLGAGAIAPVAACATGLFAIGHAADLVRHGIWRRALAGGADASLHPAVLASYRRLGVLAKGNGDVTEWACPFDEDRRGFVIGEGAGMVVIETLASTHARPWAEIAGYAATSDAGGLVRSSDDPEPLARAIVRALRNAACAPDDIDAITLHGTGTRPNDPVEAAAIHAALGSRAARVPCWSAKGTIGHLLGACGAVELVASCLMLRDGVVPPTANLRRLDPACPLDVVHGTPRHTPIRAVLKTSLGFGGHCAAMVLRRVDD
jgi:3-oxoacyl-[acyl-carrier-protein] synthase II